MYEDQAAPDEALEEDATVLAGEDEAEPIGDGISMPTLQRGSDR